MGSYDCGTNLLFVGECEGLLCWLVVCRGVVLLFMVYVCCAGHWDRCLIHGALKRCSTVKNKELCKEGYNWCQEGITSYDIDVIVLVYRNLSG